MNAYFPTTKLETVIIGSIFFQRNQRKKKTLNSRSNLDNDISEYKGMNVMNEKISGNTQNQK